jgi:integrase/recombinase XerC/integrase/recombinase XerD
VSQVVPLPGATSVRSIAIGQAIAEFLAAGDFAGSTLEVYERTLEGLLDDLGADVGLERVSRTRLESHLRARYGATAPATYNRNLATVGSLFTWAVETGHLAASPAAGLRRRKERRSRPQELQANAVPYSELQALWRDPRHRLRDRTFWALGYSTAARADELLQLDIGHLDVANRQAQIIGKGGSAERIFWDSEAARLLARLLGDRRRGPVFLADKAPSPARQPAAGDRDPDTGRARLSYRRAEEIFKAASGGRTLHKLRHSRLTHLAEAREDVTLIKAKSRHRSLRSLERYVNPSNDAVARLTGRHDPNRRGA